MKSVRNIYVKKSIGMQPVENNSAAQPVSTPSIHLVPNAPRVQFRSPLGLTRWLYALLGLKILLHVLAAVALLVSGTSRHPIGTIIVNRCFEMMVVPFMVLLAWTFVAYRNLPILGARPALRTPIVAVLIHLVPIVNLIVPFMVYKEMALESDPNTGSQGRAPVVIVNRARKPLGFSPNLASLNWGRRAVSLLDHEANSRIENSIFNIVDLSENRDDRMFS